MQSAEMADRRDVMVCIVEMKEYPRAMDFSSISGVQFSTTASRALLSLWHPPPSTAGIVLRDPRSRLKYFSSRNLTFFRL